MKNNIFRKMHFNIFILIKIFIISYNTSMFSFFRLLLHSNFISFISFFRSTNSIFSYFFIIMNFYELFYFSCRRRLRLDDVFFFFNIIYKKGEVRSLHRYLHSTNSPASINVIFKIPHSSSFANFRRHQMQH